MGGGGGALSNGGSGIVIIRYLTGYIPPKPICTSTDGQNWINVSCTAGVGNITDKINFININTSQWSNGTSFFWNNTNLLYGTNYTFHIFAYNNSGELNSSYEIVNKAMTTPITLQLLSPENGTTAASPTQLMWKEWPENAPYTYQISSDFQFINIITSGIGTTNERNILQRLNL